MAEYRELYSYLFNGITDIIEEMRNDITLNKRYLEKLKHLQAEAEEMYINQDDIESSYTGIH